jgi:hypothetical protein
LRDPAESKGASGYLFVLFRRPRNMSAAPNPSHLSMTEA